MTHINGLPILKTLQVSIVLAGDLGHFHACMHAQAMRLIKEAPFEVELTVLRKGEVEPETEGELPCPCQQLSDIISDCHSIPAFPYLSRLVTAYHCLSPQRPKLSQGSTRGARSRSPASTLIGTSSSTLTSHPATRASTFAFTIAC